MWRNALLLTGEHAVSPSDPINVLNLIIGASAGDFVVRQPKTIHARIKPVSVRCVCVLLVATSLVGCSQSSRLECSAFLSRLDIQSAVNKCSPPDAEWARTSTGSGSGGSPTSYHWSKSYNGELSCGPDSADVFLRCMGDEFKDLIKSSDGKWTDIRASSSDLTQPDFRLDYEVESRMGQIRVTLKESGDERFPTSVYIDVDESTER